MSVLVHYTKRLEPVECCYSGCGITFFLTAEFKKQRRREHDWFYCPNGHKQYYSGKSDLEKARAQLRASAQREETLRCDLEHTENRRRAEKAAKTRLKNRIKNGVCPCCNRTFANLHRHMERQHPGFAETA